MDSIKITDLAIENIEDKTQASGKDRVVKEDKNAPIIWARFYDLETHKPYFCGRDGIKKTALKDIENERRIGYSWYGNWVGVAAALDDLAAVEDEYLVCVHDGREAVSDDEDGAAGEEAIDRLLHESFRLGVESGCRLVENEDGGVRE